MSHITTPNAPLVARVRRIIGQLKRIETALEEESGCEAILHLLAGARGAFDGFSEEVIADYVREHVSAPHLRHAERHAAAEQLITLIRRYRS